MPRGVSSTIITELDKSAFEAPIYAVRITRESGTLYWAERVVTIDGQAYEARLDSHDGVDFAPGVASSYTIRALNIDGVVTALDRAESFAGCRCELLEYLPTLNLYSRRATGYLDEITEITQEIATIPVTTEHTGNSLVAIPKRSVSASCPHHFANIANYVTTLDFEGSECPYQRVSTIGFGATLLDNLDAVSDPVTFLVSWDGGIELAGAKFRATDQIRIDSEVMLVTAADDVDGNGDQEITVSRGYGSTSLAVHSVSPATFVYFANCQFSDSACIRRGMYGNNPFDTFGGTPRNYFGGFPIITGSQWGYFRSKQGEKPSYQRLNFSGNESGYGLALCVPYGKVRIADPVLILAIGEGDFLTTFWAVSEGLLATNSTDDTQTTRLNAYSGGGTGIYVNGVARHDSRAGFGVEQWNGQMDQEPPSAIWFQDYPEDFEDFFLGFNATAWLVLRINTKPNPAVDVTGQQITGAFDVEYGRVVRVYSSVSPVTYTRKATTNPAWVGLDIRTSKRVGAGVDYGRMDIQSYIDSASHNDELINSTDEDAVTSPATTVKRWTFNGVFDQKRPFGEWERMLFLGCHTIPPFPGSDGKYKIKPLKAESLVGVPVLSSIVASDARNILWEAGEAGVERSSLVKIRKSLLEIPNQITATFVDKATYTKITVTMADRDAQEALGRKLGDQSRRTIEKQYSLPGTSTIEEAARWATLLLRIGEFAQGGLANNNGVRGKLFYRGAVNLEIGDIVDLQDDQLDTLNGERYYRISRLSDQATQAYDGGFLYEREFEAWVHANEFYDDTAFTVTHFERLESNLGDDDLMNGPTPTVNNISGTEFDVHFAVPNEDAETYFEYSVYGHTSDILPTAITDETGTEGVVVAGISKLTDLSKSWTPNQWATTYDIVLFDTHRGSLSPLTRTFDYEGMFIVCQIVSNTATEITFNAPGSQVRWTMSGIEYYIVERGVGHHFWEQLAFTTPAIVDESVTVRDPSQVPGTMNRSVRLSASLTDFYVWVACYNKFGQGRVTATPAYVTYGGTATGQVDVMSIVDGRDLGGLINARQLMASSGGRFATIRPSLVNGRAQFADTTTGGFKSIDSGWTANVTDDRFGAVGDGVTDDTAALQAAIDSCANGGEVLFPQGTYLITSGLTISTDRVNLRGMGQQATKILFQPSGADTAILVDKASSPAATIVQIHIRGIAFDGTGNTQTKIAIWVNDGEEIIIDDIAISNWSSTGDDCIGLQFRGRQTHWISNYTINADLPIVIGQNPNSGIDCDHYTFTNGYTIAAPSRYNVTVEDGVFLSNVTFQNQAWVLGLGGFFFDSSTDVSASLGVSFHNIRHEQGTTSGSPAVGTGYIIRMVNANNFRNVEISNIYGGLGIRGIYLRNIFCGVLMAYEYVGSGIALDIDSTVRMNFIGNNFNATGAATINATGFVHGVWIGNNENGRVAIGSVNPSAALLMPNNVNFSAMNAAGNAEIPILLINSSNQPRFVPGGQNAYFGGALQLGGSLPSSHQCVIQNDERFGAINAAGTDSIPLIGVDGSDRVVLGGVGDILLNADLGPIKGNTGLVVRWGSNTPEGAVTAAVGSLFLRLNGGAGTTLYVKESGAGNTGWVGK